MATSASAEKVFSSKGGGARAEKLETHKALELVCVPEEEVMDNLASKFVNFSSFVGMPVEKLEVRKGRGMMVSSGKRYSPSAACIERELQK